MARHGRHCCLVKSQGGYSLAFQIPGMTVPVSFRAIGLIWVSEVDCWADVLLMSFPSHSSLYLPCGRLFLRLLWGTDTTKDFKPISHGTNEHTGVFRTVSRFPLRDRRQLSSWLIPRPLITRLNSLSNSFSHI